MNKDPELYAKFIKIVCKITTILMREYDHTKYPTMKEIRKRMLIEFKKAPKIEHIEMLVYMNQVIENRRYKLDYLNE